MAKFVIKDASITVNSVDISNHVSDVEVVTSRADVDATGMQSTHMEHLAGLADASMNLTCFQDFAAASLDSVLWPLSSSDTPFTVVVKPHAGAVSATNPSYTMLGLLLTYNPIAGQIGAAATTPVTIVNADQSGIVKAIS